MRTLQRLLHRHLRLRTASHLRRRLLRAADSLPHLPRHRAVRVRHLRLHPAERHRHPHPAVKEQARPHLLRAVKVQEHLHLLPAEKEQEHPRLHRAARVRERLRPHRAVRDRVHLRPHRHPKNASAIFRTEATRSVTANPAITTTITTSAIQQAGKSKCIKKDRQ